MPRQIQSKQDKLLQLEAKIAHAEEQLEDAEYDSVIDRLEERLERLQEQYDELYDEEDDYTKCPVAL